MLLLLGLKSKRESQDNFYSMKYRIVDILWRSFHIGEENLFLRAIYLIVKMRQDVKILDLVQFTLTI